MLTYRHTSYLKTFLLLVEVGHLWAQTPKGEREKCPVNVEMPQQDAETANELCVMQRTTQVMQVTKFGGIEESTRAKQSDQSQVQLIQELQSRLSVLEQELEFFRARETELQRRENALLIREEAFVLCMNSLQDSNVKSKLESLSAAAMAAVVTSRSSVEHEVLSKSPLDTTGTNETFTNRSTNPPGAIEAAVDGLTDTVIDGFSNELVIEMPESASLYFVSEANILSAAFILALGCCLCSNLGQFYSHETPRRATSTLDRPKIWQNQKILHQFLDESLEIESRRDIRCFSLFLNRPWRPEPGPPLKVPDFDSNDEWMEGRPFPDGETRKDNFMALSWALIRFLFRKKKPYLSIFLMVVCGMAPAVESVLFAKIADEVRNSGSSITLFNYVVALLVVRTIYMRASYMYEVDVPGASVRFELRVRLQRKFIGMVSNGAAAGAWPPGRACACLDHDVNLLVNLLWKSIFTITEHSTSIVALGAALIYVNKHTHNIKVPSLLVFLSLLIAMLGIIHGRHRNIMDVAERKRDWRLAWMALSAMQIREAREGALKDADSEKLDSDTHKFAESALVYRSRGFHNWFVNLLASMAMSEMAFCCKCILAFYGGVMAQQGKLTPGQALALLSVGDLMGKSMTKLVTVSLNVRVGFASLLDICEVFNCETK